MMGGLKKFGCSKTNIKTMSFFFVWGSTLQPYSQKKKKKTEFGFLSPRFYFILCLNIFV